MEQKQVNQDMMRQIEEARAEGAKLRAKREASLSGDKSSGKEKTALQKTANVLDMFFGGGKVGEAIGTKIAEMTAPEDIKPYIDTNTPNAQELAGSAATSALLFTPVGRLAKTLGTGAKALGASSKIAKGAGAIGAGAIEGYGFDVASSLEQNEKGKDIFTPGVGTVLGGAAPAIISPLATKANRYIHAMKHGPKEAAKEEITRFIDTGSSSKTLKTEVKRLQKKNIDMYDELSDPDVFYGMKVKNGKIDVTDSVKVKEMENDVLGEIKSKMLKEIDTQVPKVKKSKVFNNMASEVTEGTENQKQNIIKAIKREMDKYPEYMSVSKIDELRAAARKSGITAKDDAKPNSHFVAMMLGARKTEFEITDNIPTAIDKTGVFAQVNDRIRKNISVIDFLNGKVNGSTVKGGRLGRMSGRVIGAVAGAQGGPFVSLLVSGVGDTISKILIDSTLSQSVKMRIIRSFTKGLPNEKAIINQAEIFLNELKRLNRTERKLLPSPAIRAGAPKQVESAATIVRAELGPDGVYASSPEGFIRQKVNEKRSNKITE